MKSKFYISLILLIFVNIAYARTTVVRKSAVPLYGTFELTIKVPGIKGNKFRKFASVVFSNKNRRFNVDGFFDGGDTWRVNFMPDNIGVWNYSYSIEKYSGNGSFFCTAKKNNDIHGHVKIDPDNPRYLIHEDGTVHYWFGSLWFRKQQYGPHSINGVPNAARQSDEKLLSTLDIIKEYKHNGALLKISLFPIENDKFTWNLSWINRAEWLVREMGNRGIYCHINMFDTWSRDRDFWLKSNTNSKNHVFNVWANEDDDAKKNYIRTIVARFAGFYNVYWELGNEMNSQGSSAWQTFVEQANSKYIPWIKEFDPYDLPVGLSAFQGAKDEARKADWTDVNVDVGFTHNYSELPTARKGLKPTIMNEINASFLDPNVRLWNDKSIRNQLYRYDYRLIIWRMFTNGGCGSISASLLKTEYPLNSAVYNVMADQCQLRGFIQNLPLSINEMYPLEDFILSNSLDKETRSKPGICYVTYIWKKKTTSTSAWKQKIKSLWEKLKRLRKIRVNLPSGAYIVQWFNPSTGDYFDQTEITSSGRSQSLQLPYFSEDIVLLVVNRAIAD